jgi:DNA-binding beta-propeller fold protein YncE
MMDTQRRRETQQDGRAPSGTRFGVLALRRCAMAFAVVGILAVPASASASFTSLTPVNGPPGGDEGWCPAGVALDSGAGGTPAVYVADPCNSQLDKFTADGSTLDWAIGGEDVPFCTDDETADQTFNSGPDGVAVDPLQGDAYVTDSENNEIDEFDPSGNFLGQAGGGTTSTACDTEGGDDSSTSLGYLNEPQGLTFADGALFVADTDNNRVEVFPRAFGPPITAIDADSSQGDAEDVAVDPDSGDVFVIDDEEDQVLEYSGGGTFIRQFASGFDSTGFGQPEGVAVDPVAHVVYVADTEDQTVDSFDETTGASLQQITGLFSPQALAVDPVNHVLYVAEGNETEGPRQSATHGPDITDPPLDPPLDRPGVDVFSFTAAPMCTAQPSDSAVTGVAKPLALVCTDAAGAPLTYAIDAGPAHGTLSAFNSTTGAVTYTPAAGYAGSDRFTFQASSANGTSAAATVTIKVAPNCAPETLSTGYEHSVSVTVVCSPASSYEIVRPAGDGSLTTPTAAGGVTYSPNSLFVGTDSFTYAGVSNGVTSAPATVTLDVGTSLPPPVEGQTANVYFSSGTVLIYLPGQTTPIPLLAGMQVPLGSIIDATNGRVGIFVEIDGAIQSADFFDGKFKLTQEAAPATVLQRARPASLTQVPGPQTLLQLLGRKVPKVKCAVHPHSFSGTFTVSPTHGKFEPLLAQIARKKAHGGKPTRQLWGSGHGDFTTVGGGSSASVRGTEWAIFDYPDGTLTFDFTDSVTVDDFYLHKTVIITAGHYYFAALGNLPRCR